MLRQEFPDVTISKIRFLESQGLLDPERTPSGYRKFYESDIDQLRWILTQQKENFLPLKVIKDRMVERDGEPDEGDDDPPAERVTSGTEPAAVGPAAPVWMADAARRRSRQDQRRPAVAVRPARSRPGPADRRRGLGALQGHQA